MCTQYTTGLLTMAVLFCLFSACSSEKTTPTSDTPNPLRYLILGSPNESSTRHDTIVPTEIAQLQHGDILLRKGFGSISAYIADFLNETYPITHCGFLLEQAPNEWFVLHCISEGEKDGLILEPLNDFVHASQHNTLVAIRLNDTTQLVPALEKAQQLLDKNIAFDMLFDDSNPDALYCIEMMRDVLKEAYQKDFFPKRTQTKGISVLSMENFFDSTHFNTIFNHFEAHTAHTE